VPAKNNIIFIKISILDPRATTTNDDNDNNNKIILLIRQVDTTLAWTIVDNYVLTALQRG